MKREIKFRAWDQECEKMFYSDMEYDDHFFEFKDGQLFCFSIIENGFAGSIYEPPSPTCEKLDNLMQFTGLLDNNGKEIYEGDIVKWLGYEVRDGKQIRPERMLVVGEKDLWIADCFYIKSIIENNGILEVIDIIYKGEVNDGKTD